MPPFWSRGLVIGLSILVSGCGTIQTGPGLCVNLFQGPSQFLAFDVFGAVETSPRGINNIGQIVGFYKDTGGKIHGFRGSPDTSLDPFDLPGANATLALGINNAGAIVGTFSDDTGMHPFQLAGGTVSILDGLPIDVRGTNDDGSIVGTTSDGEGYIFTPVGSSGGLVFFKIGGRPTALNGINNGRRLVGAMLVPKPPGPMKQAFFLVGPDLASATPIEIGEAVSSEASGLNNAADPQCIRHVGMYTQKFGNVTLTRGFVHLQGGPIALFDMQDAVDTIPRGINDKGEIVGEFRLPNGRVRGFLAR